jgi:hypothetical protein
MNTKIKTSESVVIKRSEINFAPYNPRDENPNVIKSLKKNFKSVGYMGGIVWNALSGNLVGGDKRIKAMDQIYNYDGTPETDYDVKVERVELAEKEEIEQNIYLNNPSVQGTYDFEKLANLLPEIDTTRAGLTSDDLDLIAAYVPDVDFGNNKPIMDDIASLGAELDEKTAYEKAQKKAEKQAETDKPETKPFEYRDVKQKQHDAAQQAVREKYVTLSFTTYDAKYLFMTRFGFDPEETIIKGEEFDKKLQ